MLNSNDGNVRVTSYQSGSYRTIASAIAMGGIYDSEEHTRADLMERYLRFLIPAISNNEDTQPIAKVELHSAYPNPFNPTTNISFTLPENQAYSLSIYDIKGRLVKVLSEGFGNKGMNRFVWNGTNNENQAVGSGVYLCRLNTKGSSKTIKLTMIK